MPASAKASEAEKVITVQAVNEFGGLSKLGKANDATGILQAEATGELALEGVYAADGTQLTTPSSGLNIVKYRDSKGNVLVKKVLY
jgi:hypothetical protein